MVRLSSQARLQRGTTRRSAEYSRLSVEYRVASSWRSPHASLVQGHCPNLAWPPRSASPRRHKRSPAPEAALQEAIYSANFDRNVAIDSTNPDHFIATECESGSGDDVIVLPERAEFFMARVLDDAHNPVGPTATPIVFSKVRPADARTRRRSALQGVSEEAEAPGVSVDGRRSLTVPRRCAHAAHSTHADRAFSASASACRSRSV